MKEETELFNFNYLVLLILSIFTAISFSMVTPVLTKYAANIGLGLSVAGSLSGILSITALLARPFSGLASDRINKKLLMVASTTVSGVAVYLSFLRGTGNEQMGAMIRCIRRKFVMGIGEKRYAEE